MTQSAGLEQDFLRGGGELGALMRSQDWSATGLGPPAQWPRSLKTAIRIMLTSRQPFWIGWGKDLTFFYNDPYKSIVGGKHPWALGRPTSVVWEEIWGDIAPMLQTAMTGEEGTFAEEQLLIMERSGYREETYYTFSYSPIPDDDGSAGGIICANSEDTGRVIGERQLALLRELGARTADARTWDQTCRAVEDALCTNARDLTFALLYMAEEGSGALTLAASCGIAADHPGASAGAEVWPLAGVMESQAAVLVEIAQDRFAHPLPSGVWGEPVQRVGVLPVPAAGETGRPGVLVVGLNPFRAFDESYSGFLQLAAGQISAAFANAEAYEQERRRAEKLAELDRAKTTFFSNISHEFRTPLTLMLGPLEEVLSKPEALVYADNRHLVDVAHRNGLRLMRLVNALLDFSRIEAGRVQARYRATDLAAYTAELASTFRSATDKAGLALVIDTTPLPEPAYVDREMWEKLVLNLISNAFKFTFEGEIRVTLQQVGDSVRLAVSDTGIGIAEEDMPKLFERFQRIEGAKGRSFEGSGIGLALVQELARLHGGDVSARSEPDRGSTFEVTIPAGKAHLPADRIELGEAEQALLRADAFVEEALRWLPSGEELAPGERGGSRDLGSFAGSVPDDGIDQARVLLADDNGDMREYVERLLGTRYLVEAVRDGEEALAAIRREPPDLVLTDVMMPRLDGFGLLAEIRAAPELRDLPVVMLSARAGEEAQVEGLEAGADDYLVKPFSARELMARVSTNLELARSRRAAREALEQLNAQLRAETDRLSKLFLDTPSVMAVLRGPDHVFELANPAYVELIGQRPLIGAAVAEALPELVEQGFIALLDTVREIGEPFIGKGVQVKLARGPSGEIEERAIDFVFQPIKNGQGQVEAIFVEGTDVTERIAAEHELQQYARVLERINHTGVTIASELELRKVVQTVTDAGVELTEAQFGAFFYNMIGEDGESYMLFTLSGVDSAAFQNFPMPRNTEVFAPTFEGLGVVRSDDITADPRYGRNGPHKGMPEGHLPVRSYLAVPVQSRTGEVVGGLFFGHPEAARFDARHEQVMVGIAAQAAIAIDNARLFEAAQRELSERRQAEEAVRELNQSLEQRIAEAISEREAVEDVLRQAQKMEAVGQLTGGVAHDFNNLLTIITGNMDMALRAIEAEGGNARAKRAVGNALKGAERAAALTQRLLAFSRRQPLAPKALDADKLIAGISELMMRSLGETIRLETITAPGLWRIEADSNQLESALLNLAVNARDAMPEGGKLTIETANAHLDEAYSVGQAEVAPGDYVVIAVSDTGTGMSKETLARVFEPFFTTKEVGRGTGLGLSMVYGFVKQSGGNVKLYSELGEGTTVKIYLPRLLADGAEEEAVDSAVATPGTQDETILVVEDDDDVRAYTVEILRELGYRVLEAHDGPAALRLIERADVPIDLLFTDVVMPGMSGRELSDAARAIRPHLRVLYTSGYTRNAIVHGGRLDPGVQIIAKPFTFDALAAKVREVIDGSTSGRFLMVSDEAAVRLLAVEALTGAGYAVDEARNAEEAVQKVRAARCRYNAVILDGDLADGRSAWLARELRATRSDLTLLLMVAPGERLQDSLAADPHAASVAKPLKVGELLAGLQRLDALANQSRPSAT